MKTFNYGFHPFHIVDYSPWPLIGSVALMSLMINAFMFFSSLCGALGMLISLASVIMVMIEWWRDVVRESTFQGHHSVNVCNGLHYGIIMFILSEVMFFFSFFFGFFFTALNPDIELGSSWPPVGIQPLLFSSIPALNTIILISSGISITWSHHSLISSDLSSSKMGMLITIILGIWFSSFQYKEYFDCCFSMADSVYGSLFFISTGFHGLHVIIGALFITVSLIRLSLLHMSSFHHLGFEAAAWYWHFVDVVWLFLFVSVYWWGS